MLEKADRFVAQDATKRLFQHPVNGVRGVSAGSWSFPAETAARAGSATAKPARSSEHLQNLRRTRALDAQSAYPSAPGAWIKQAYALHVGHATRSATEEH